MNWWQFLHTEFTTEVQIIIMWLGVLGKFGLKSFIKMNSILRGILWATQHSSRLASQFWWRKYEKSIMNRERLTIDLWTWGKFKTDKIQIWLIWILHWVFIKGFSLFEYEYCLYGYVNCENSFCQLKTISTFLGPKIFYKTDKKENINKVYVNPGSFINSITH